MPHQEATRNHRYLYEPDYEPRTRRPLRRRKARQQRLARAAALWLVLLGACALFSHLTRRPAERPAEAALLTPAATRRMERVAGWRGQTRKPTRTPAARSKPTRRKARAADKPRGNWMQVWATAYCPTCRVCDTGRITATGRHAWSRGLAVAARGRRVAPLGSRVYVPRFGWLPVDDTGGGVRSNQIDIRMKTHRRAVKWGRRRMRVMVASR